MSGLRERLHWSAEAGAVADGTRRYLLMRPDVLMGALARLDEPVQRAWLDAVAESAREHGGDSLRAYATTVGHDADALIAATAAAAADLGWGRWTLRREGEGALHLEVTASPFAAGWLAAGGGTAPVPVCSPVRGIFGALAALCFPGRQVDVGECECAAMRCEGATAAPAGPAEAALASCRFQAKARALTEAPR